MNTENPFSFSAATDLTVEDVLHYYIPEHNYSRFIQSKRNVFLLGERGTGKTMTLLYHTLRVQKLKAEKEGTETDWNWVGVYVPCNTPLMLRTEHELLDDHRAFALSEHFLALSILGGLVSTLEEPTSAMDEVPHDQLSNETEMVLATELPPADTFFARMRLFATAETRRSQIAINRPDDDFYSNAYSFATLVLPILAALNKIPALRDAHFLLLVDDADYLNRHQVAALNSWIAYREHSRFSFKVATSKVLRPSRLTATGGTIEEGHDFTTVDMESPLHNERSDFGRLARLIVKRRLDLIGCPATPEEFFPISPAVAKQLEVCKKRASNLAQKKYPNGTQKQITDYVYKYHRALFFKRKPKANRPVYSGFDMLTYLSTGIVRNLLEPCYVMFDIALSRASDGGTSPVVDQIDPTIQNEAIRSLSERPWNTLKDGLHKHIPNCTKEQSDQIARLFDALARLFRKRLGTGCSEPRATSFTISGGETGERAELDELLVIARKALLVYVRVGPAKDAGSREVYYVPARMLWPTRGLDPLGQHARVSLKARDLMAAARGAASPWTEVVDSDTSGERQRDLFDGED